MDLVNNTVSHSIAGLIVDRLLERTFTTLRQHEILKNLPKMSID